MPTVATPPAINKTQKTHRHPACWAMKPPQIGPTTGPKSGPALQMDVAIPRWATGNISAIRPAPTVRHPDPPMPAMNREKTRRPMLGARAQPICQATKKIFVQVSTIRRPHISLMGASTKGPN
ncbi:hypothetical protein, variant [Exophiala oligosperma]|uniref:Uncharacterized protein n=1 Tax=Exophiala oligosperma TaxID=215243 RepID=A0A0D2DC90_9EURO|nr:uncharacterized protein PV06_07900 [Exophiala oligosperma]XP_016260940.1 hypothetical protein, variant [Exophiala oligosperma]KIW40723.1 hypothetical protein PV06_07900 [Exophiala oligosperma]KIW40724.1 hypothetical protein, variant [Exophiala oligosperma]